MNLRSLQIAALFISIAFGFNALAQSPTSKVLFPHTEVIFAQSTFFDFGPPFDFYTLFHLTSTASGTDVEKIAMTPPGDACTQPATTEVSHVHLEQSLADLFNHKDPCIIPDKELHREAKRCKHCLVFSGVHIVAQVQCKGKPRAIRYEVLDRDLFDTHPSTPNQTLDTMKLMGILNDAFGKSDMDRPMFVTLSSKSAGQQPSDDLTTKAIADGSYDSLFSESVAKLYKDSQLPPKAPSITLKVSPTSAPISPVMPTYPPIARAAHIQGDVVLQLRIDTNGKVVEENALSGPVMLYGVSLEAAKNWSYPPGAVTEAQSVTIHFDMNCTNVETTTSSESPKAAPPTPFSH